MSAETSHSTQDLPRVTDNTCDISYSFLIEGVKCGKCIQKLENLPLLHSELADSRFSQGNSSLKLVTKAPVSESTLIQWIEDKGFKASLLVTSLQVENFKQQLNRNWLIRLAVTFAVTSNIMMFTASIYSGAMAEWKLLFHSLSAALFLVIAGYSVLPFYKSAWTAIKQKQFSADLALVIAFVWGSALSYVNLLRGRDEIFFDSTASFVFLILLTRYFLWKAQTRNSIDLNSDVMFQSGRSFSVETQGQLTKTDYQKLMARDIFTVLPNQTIPTDGVLLSPAVAYVSSAFFSGESAPLTLTPGAPLRAGQICLSEPLRMQALQSFSDSEMGKIFQQLHLKLNEKTASVLSAEIWTKRLLTTVSVASLLLVAYFAFNGHWEVGFQRALALFTIACPCALSFAIPLASTRSISLAARNGLLVKSPLFFENLAKVKKVIFDKTGTLTKGSLKVMELQWFHQTPNDQDLAALLSLTKPSSHPLSQSAHSYLTTLSLAPLELQNWQETAQGPKAQSAQSAYEINAGLSSNWGGPGFSLLKDGQKILEVHLQDELRPEAKSLIQNLKAKGLQVSIATGDRRTVAAQLAQEAGIVEVHAELSPEQKMQLAAENSFLVGDGHNDSLAMSQATCSLAVGGAASTSLASAQAYSTHTGLQVLLTAFKFKDFYQQLVKQNLILSLSYNVIAATLAILGFVSPLMAAVLMPINSFIVITATLLKTDPMNFRSGEH